MLKIYTLKRSITALVAAVFMLAGSGAGTASAETVQIWDLFYELDPTGKTATLAPDAAYTSMTTIEIPAKVNDGTSDYTVTAIAQQCFQSCTNMTSIVLPNTLESIGKWAFYGCSGLKNIDFPSSLTTISDLAFQKCTGLERITLPANLQTVGASAFTGCSSLTEAILNDNLTALPTAVFNDCYNLSNVTFPSKLESIGNNAFYGCALTSAELPASLKTIGDAVFSRCTNLKKVTIPGNLQSMGNQIFYECNALEEVVLGEGIESLGESLFYNNKSLKNITLPQSLKSLSKHLFHGCLSLTNIVLPAAITAIPNNCFSDCTSLQTAPLNNNITEIGNEAFSGCESLETVTLPAKFKNLNNNVFAYCSKLTTVLLNEGLEKIGNTVFHTNTALTSISIPASVTTIGDNPFAGCSNLTKIDVAAGNSNFTSTDGVLTDKAAKVIFSYPGGMTQWVMPESIEEIAPYSFNSLPNVTDITFSPNIKKVGMSAFYNTKITEAIFTDKLESIDNMAFFMVKTLEKIVFGNTDFTLGNNSISATAVRQLLFPESVKTIGIDSYGFGILSIGSNTRLTAVWLPSTLEKLSPFGTGCANLAKIYCWAKTPPTLVGFNPMTIAPEVYVPKGTASAYQAAWSELYPNVTFKDVLPGDPVLDAENGVSRISWEPFTEEGYIGNVETYTLTLYKGQGDGRTEIFTEQLNANGEKSGTKAEGAIPAKITVGLGTLEAGDYSVSLKGFTSLGEMVMNFENNFSATTAGIDDIVADSDMPAEYYNMQGIRVMNPVKGNIYIMRKGSTAEKVVF